MPTNILETSAGRNGLDSGVDSVASSGKAQSPLVTTSHEPAESLSLKPLVFFSLLSSSGPKVYEPVFSPDKAYNRSSLQALQTDLPPVIGSDVSITDPFHRGGREQVTGASSEPSAQPEQRHATVVWAHIQGHNTNDPINTLFVINRSRDGGSSGSSPASSHNQNQRYNERSPETARGGEGGSNRGGGGIEASSEGGETEGRRPLRVMSTRQFTQEFPIVAAQAREGARFVITRRGEPVLTGTGITLEEAREMYRRGFGEEAAVISSSELLRKFGSVTQRAINGEEFVVLRNGVPAYTVRADEIIPGNQTNTHCISYADLAQNTDSIFSAVSRGEKIAVASQGQLLRIEEINNRSLTEAFGTSVLVTPSAVVQHGNIARITARTRGEEFIAVFRNGVPILHLNAVDTERMYHEEFGSTILLSLPEVRQRTTDLLLPGGQKTLLTHNGEVVATVTGVSKKQVRQMYREYLGSDTTKPVGSSGYRTETIATAQPGEKFIITNYNVPVFTIRILEQSEAQDILSEGFTEQDAVPLTQATFSNYQNVEQRVAQHGHLIGTINNFPRAVIDSVTMQQREEMLRNTFGTDTMVTFLDLKSGSSSIVANAQQGTRILVTHYGEIVSVIDGVTTEQLYDIYERRLFGEGPPGDASPDTPGGNLPDKGPGSQQSGTPNPGI